MDVILQILNQYPKKYITCLKETDGFVQFGLELIDVFESVGNIRAFMQVSISD